MSFTAKDIQRLVRITKIRYHYLKEKADIQPEIDEVEGTGNVHKYSFKNLMEFAIAHQASNTGMPPGRVAALIKHVNEFEKDVNSGLFDEASESNFFHIYLFNFVSTRVFCIDSDKGRRYFTYVPDAPPRNPILNEGEGEQSYLDLSKFETDKEIESALVSDGLVENIVNAQSLIKINADTIKRDILKRL